MTHYHITLHIEHSQHTNTEHRQIFNCGFRMYVYLVFSVFIGLSSAFRDFRFIAELSELHHENHKSKAATNCFYGYASGQWSDWAYLKPKNGTDVQLRIGIEVDECSGTHLSQHRQDAAVDYQFCLQLGSKGGAWFECSPWVSDPEGVGRWGKSINLSEPYTKARVMVFSVVRTGRDIPRIRDFRVGLGTKDEMSLTRYPGQTRRRHNNVYTDAMTITKNGKNVPVRIYMDVDAFSDSKLHSNKLHALKNIKGNVKDTESVSVVDEEYIETI